MEPQPQKARRGPRTYFLVFQVFLAVFIGGSMITFSQPRMYQATATRMIQAAPQHPISSPNRSELDFHRMGPLQIPLATHCLFLTSRQLANQTAERLQERNKYLE